MNKSVWVVLLAVALGGCDSAIDSRPAVPVKLYGVDLASATRSQLRAALQKAGLPAVTVDDSGEDVYDAKGSLNEVDKLTLTYNKANQFVCAGYTFPSFVDAAQIGRVKAMLVQKYGEPSSEEGNELVGPVRLGWLSENGIVLILYRNWPSTTTYLDYCHREHLSQQASEDEVVEQQKNQAELAAHSHAF